LLSSFSVAWLEPPHLTCRASFIVLLTLNLASGSGRLNLRRSSFLQLAVLQSATVHFQSLPLVCGIHYHNL
jgi:hypothetical protein